MPQNLGLWLLAEYHESLRSFHKDTKEERDPKTYFFLSYKVRRERTSSMHVRAYTPSSYNKNVRPGHGFRKQQAYKSKAWACKAYTPVSHASCKINKNVTCV